jgi:hypothetical protein
MTNSIRPGDAGEPAGYKAKPLLIEMHTTYSMLYPIDIQLVQMYKSDKKQVQNWFGQITGIDTTNPPRTNRNGGK